MNNRKNIKKNNVSFRQPLVNPYLVNQSFKSNTFNKVNNNIKNKLLQKNNVQKNNVQKNNVQKNNVQKNNVQKNNVQKNKPYKKPIKNKPIKNKPIKNKPYIKPQKNNVQNISNNRKPYIKRSITISRITLDKEEPSTMKKIFFIILGSLLVFSILVLGKMVYMYFTDSKKPHFTKKIQKIIFKEKKPLVTKDTIPEEKKGVNIAIEKGHNMSENSYISSNPEVSPNEMNDYAVFDETMIEKTSIQNEKNKVNEYIKQQNAYIRNINGRVAQINENRMNTPTYNRDVQALHDIRNFERKLANKVHREHIYQPYLPDQ